MQPRHEVPSYVGIQLCVQGYAVPKPRSYTYIRKTVSNTSESMNATHIATTNNHVTESDTGDRDKKNFEEDNCDHGNQISDDSCANVEGNVSNVCSNKQPGSNSNSTSAPVPTTQDKAGQTSSSTSHDNRPHPTSFSIVEINCKLPNTNLRVS